jgi:hypothetical protein
VRIPSLVAATSLEPAVKTGTHDHVIPGFATDPRRLVSILLADDDDSNRQIIK